MKKNRNPILSPIALFFLFLISSSFLSYMPMILVAKSWVFVAGILLPFTLGLSHLFVPERKDLFRSETVKSFEWRWLWILLALLAVFLRFFKLSSLYIWPTGDEGLHGFLAIPLLSKWDWQFFYTVGEHPPLLIWALVPGLKWLDSPFLSLWIWPAFFSAATVVVGYWVSRRFFSSSFSLLFGGLLAFSFWPLYSGRFCHQGIFVPFWELFGFLLLSFFLKGRTQRSRLIWIVLLGLWTGSGTLTFTAWFVVLTFVILTVLGLWFRGYRRHPGYLAGFFVGLGLGMTPFVVAAVHEGYGRHFLDASSANHFFSTAHAFLTRISYLTCLFWGSLLKGTSYGPVWGGILNPVLSSFFFLGAIELFHQRSKGFLRWTLLGFLMCLLPGLLSADYVEFNRVIQVMPFLLLITAFGIQRLLVSLRVRSRVTVILLLLLSFGLDLFHFLKPALAEPVTRFEFKKRVPDENFNAYRILEDEYLKRGPGLVLTDFLLWSHGHTLNVTTYRFNTALNPKLDRSMARWAGVIVNEHYRSFLSKRFRNATWYFVSPSPGAEGGMVVGIIPIDAQNHAVVERWSRAHDYFHHLSLQAENIFNHRDRYRSALEHLADGYPLMQGDPFLESCFGEWMAQYHWGDDHGMNARIMERTIAHGYPCAHLYYKLGEFLYLDDRYPEARSAFQKALRCVPNHTQAAEAIRVLDSETRPK